MPSGVACRHANLDTTYLPLMKRYVSQSLHEKTSWWSLEPNMARTKWTQPRKSRSRHTRFCVNKLMNVKRSGLSVDALAVSVNSIGCSCRGRCSTHFQRSEQDDWRWNADGETSMRFQFTSKHSPIIFTRELKFSTHLNWIPNMCTIVRWNTEK